MKRIAMTVAVGLFALVGCRSDEPRTNITPNEAPATPATIAPADPPAAIPADGIGGGPREDGWSREGVIDRLSHARCQARERCGAVGGPTSDHTSFGECVERARVDLRGSFGASSSCNESYDTTKLDGCARELGESACGDESKLSDNCVESKLCK